VVAGFSPVIKWNYDHQWITALVVDKLGHKGHAGFGEALQYFVETLLGQLILVPPTIIGIAVAAPALRRFRRAPDAPELLLALLSLPMLIYFLLISFRTPVQANWPALAHVPLVILAVHWIVDAWNDPRKKITRGLGIAGFGIACLLTVFFHVQALYPLLPIADIIRAMGIPDRAVDLTDQAYGWEELALRVQNEIDASTDPSRTIAGSRNYQIASELEYHLSGHPLTFSADYATKGNNYDLRVDYGELEGWTFVIVERPGKKLTSRFRKHFDSCRRLPDFEFTRRGRSIGVSHVWRCDGFGLEGAFAEYFEDPLGNVVQRLKRKREGR